MIIVLTAWMLDRAACADMVIGAPRAELAALVELHDLLIERGFRRSSLCDPRIVKEEQNEHIAEVGFDHGASAGRGSASALHHVRFDPVAGNERVGAHESDRVSGGMPPVPLSGTEPTSGRGDSIICRHGPLHIPNPPRFPFKRPARRSAR